MHRSFILQTIFQMLKCTAHSFCKQYSKCSNAPLIHSANNIPNAQMHRSFILQTIFQMLKCTAHSFCKQYSKCSNAPLIHSANNIPNAQMHRSFILQKIFQMLKCTAHSFCKKYSKCSNAPLIHLPIIFRIITFKTVGSVSTNPTFRDGLCSKTKGIQIVILLVVLI